MNRQRVLVIARDFPPANTAGTFRTLRFVKYLPEYGWEPLVLTVQATVDEFERGRSLVEQLPAGLVIERVRPWWQRSKAEGCAAAERPIAAEPSSDAGKPFRKSGWLRGLARDAWHLVSQTPDRNAWWVPPATRRGRTIVRRHSADLLYTTGPPHSTHLIGKRLKRQTRLPWVADLRDPWARRPWGPKRSNPWGEWLAPRFEAACVRAADRVVVNTEPAADDFRARYPDLDAAHFVAIPNGYDPELAETVAHLVTELTPAAPGEYLRLCHPGSLYGRRDPRPIVDAIAELAHTGLRIRLEQIGPCRADFRLAEHAAARGVTDLVTVESQMPHDALMRRMAQADLLLLLQPDAPLMVPGKLYEMMLFGRPIVAITDEGPTADIVRSCDLGAIAASDNPASIADALRAAATSAVSGAGRWRPAAESFDGRKLAGRLAATLDVASAASANLSAVRPALAPVAREMAPADPAGP